MASSQLWISLVVLLHLGLPPSRADDLSQFTVPDGYEVTLAAGPPLVKYPMQGAFDDRGRLYLCENSGLNLDEKGLLEQLPNFIRRVEDSDGDGVFDKSTIFADKMTFPSGALWHRGALYVASPPNVWKLEDTDDDGVADVRTPILGKFHSLGHAGDIHGPFLAPDGRLVITDAPLGHEIHAPDGTLVSKGTAARVFICDTDGGNLETFCGGGMYNPVEVAFTPEGEMLGIMTWYNPGEARHDALVHYVYGGVYPKRVEAWINEFQRTGPLMPAILRYGVVAPSSIIRYRSDQLGAHLRDRYFIAYFNTRNVTQVRLKRSGATFSAEEENLLTSTNPDFRPCEVIEDADGSLLVIDTGGWFINGCPSSRIAKPEITGGIYRIRKKGAHQVADAWGSKLDWQQLEASQLMDLLADHRPVVRERALDTLAQRGESALQALGVLMRHEVAPAKLRMEGVFALSRMQNDPAKALIREALKDTDHGVRLAALRTVGSERDADALTQIQELLESGDAAEKREAATALGRIGTVASIPMLLDALAQVNDRFLEHALIFALIEINTPEPTAAGLDSASRLTRRGALIALDQMRTPSLTREQVAPLLADKDKTLRETAVAVFAKHPDWANEVAEMIGKWCAEIALGAAAPKEMRPLLAAFVDQPSVQDVLAIHPDNQTISTLTLEAMVQIPSLSMDAALPRQVIAFALSLDDKSLALQVLKRHGAASFAHELKPLGDDANQPARVRLQVAEALSLSDIAISDTLHVFLCKHATTADVEANQRLMTFRLLGELSTTESQRARIAPLVALAGPLEIGSLLPALVAGKDEVTGLALVKALAQSPGLHALSATSVHDLVSNYPDTVKQAAAPLKEMLEEASAHQASRLAELKPALEGGNPVLGKEVFLSARALCSVCHRIDRFGGTLGPDLSSIGEVRTRQDLLEAIVFPGASFARGYEPVQIDTHDGETVHGVIRKEKADAIVIGFADGSERRLARDQIEQTSLSAISLMPPGLDTVLTMEELQSLLAYLASLGQAPKP